MRTPTRLCLWHGVGKSQSGAPTAAKRRTHRSILFFENGRLPPPNTAGRLAKSHPPHHHHSHHRETYQYYDLPMCQPASLKHKPESLGGVVDGHRHVASPYAIAFKVDAPTTTLCSRVLTGDDIAKLRSAVLANWFATFLFDGLPIYSFLGRADAPRPGGDAVARLYTHHAFEFKYNGDRVVEASVVTDPAKSVDLPADAADPVTVTFTYSVSWAPSDVPFAKRMDRYRADAALAPHHLEVHWLAVANSCVTVLLLTGLLATILLRVLRSDFARYAAAADAESDLVSDAAADDETGWKFLHGDVFRFPPAKALFCALLGVGAQLAAVAAGTLPLALGGAFGPHAHGALPAALLVLYAFTAAVAGYVAGSYYRQMGGRAWVRTTLLTAGALGGPLLLAFAVANSVAIAYGSTAALPAGTIAGLTALWAIVTLPLTVAGAVIGKNGSAPFAAPTRTAKFARVVPPLPWWRSGFVQVVGAGLLPFSAIFVELSYVHLSVWGLKTYTLAPILAIVFVLLLIVTAIVAVALTYFQLAAEDHRWWWRSWACGASTGAWVFGYSCYFYTHQSEMSGALQASFYFGYSAVAAGALSLLLGFVAWRACLAFVRAIYKAVKCE